MQKTKEGTHVLVNDEIKPHVTEGLLRDASLGELAVYPAFLGSRERIPRLVVAVYGTGETRWPDWKRNGALYAASSMPSADNPRYSGWRALRDAREPHALFVARDVPIGIAAAVEAQGTSDQVYDDGYKALKAVAQYLDLHPFYEFPRDWTRE